MWIFNPYHSKSYKGRKGYNRSRYWPHQGKKECARRLREMAKAKA